MFEMIAMSSRERPKISETDRMYWPCLWWPRRFTKMPMSWSSAATSSRRRSRAWRPCSERSSSNRLTASAATCFACAHVVAVALAERLGRAEHLAREVLDPLALVASAACRAAAPRAASPRAPARSGPASRAAARGTRRATAPASRPRRAAAGRPRPARRRRAPPSARRTTGSARAAGRARRAAVVADHLVAAKRTSPPSARKWRASRSGSSRRMSSTTLRTVRW